MRTNYCFHFKSYPLTGGADDDNVLVVFVVVIGFGTELEGNGALKSVIHIR